MSDSEDEEVILDDIKALQEALTQNKSSNSSKDVKSQDLISIKPNLHDPSTSNNFDNLTSTDPLLESSDDECSSDENNLEYLTDPEAALNLNIRIISLLRTAQKRLELLLLECQKRQLAVDQKINKRTADPFSRTLLTIAGIPYFKDKKQFPAPKNYDARLKASRGELQIIDLPRPLRWSVRDRNTLWGAIYRNTQEIGERGEPLSNKIEDPLRIDHKFRGKKIPEGMIQNIRELVGPLGSREFDWLKIAATDFNGKHSASECRAMWNMFLHPDINKGMWKKVEETNLKSLASKHKLQNWDVIAKKLGTNRSGYQCLLRFNSNINTFGSPSSWSKEEDQKLTDAVNTLRTGNFIPWGEVAKLMGNRRKQQIYMRWKYSLAPNLTKGRFTEAENKLLREGVAKFGFNFTKISAALMPHRHTAQLNDHYKTLITKKENEWNYEDDIKLTKLFNKLGNNWSAIAKEFSNKSRVQVRHRHAAIGRYLKKGLAIDTIPRVAQKPVETDTPESSLSRGAEMLEEMSKRLTNQQPEHETGKRDKTSKIDLELRDYFKAIYKTSSKRGRNKKFYSDEELKESTQRLDVILNILDSELDIPDDSVYDELSLTEKDKQLVTALKVYSETSSGTQTSQKYIEYIRRKMFGDTEPSTDENRFIPPLPFSITMQKSKKKKLDGINYEPDGNKCLIELDCHLITPEIIVSLNGGWEHEIEFQNMEKLFLGKTAIRSNWNEDNFNTFDPNVPSTSGVVSNENQNSASYSETPSSMSAKYYPKLVLPPNYVTLLGFRSILLSKHMLKAEDSEDSEDSEELPEEECTITPKGEEALKLFEERLIKLFKFPIELSEIAPPLLHGLDNGQANTFDDDDNCKKKRKTGTKSQLEPVAKRKAVVDKVDVVESSKAD